MSDRNKPGMWLDKNPAPTRDVRDDSYLCYMNTLNDLINYLIDDRVVCARESSKGMRAD